MARVIVHAREAVDDRRHARQCPQLRAEAIALRPSEQGALDPCQLPGVEPRLSAQPPHRLQTLASPSAPEVIPAMRRLPTDAEPLHDRGLRLALREQPRRFEPPRFQRGTAPSPSSWTGHAPASDSTR